MKKIWFDVTNSPQVHFQVSIMRALESKFDFFFTTRNFAETNYLLKEKINENFISIGGHVGKNKILKVLNMILRVFFILSYNLKYDISISNGSDSAIYSSKIKRKKAITFGDNDTAPHWIHGKFVDFAFFPDAISKSYIESQYIDSSRYYRYNGYKEDIYIADYIPDNNFFNKVPFRDYVLVRSENIQANYIKNGRIRSITPSLLEKLSNSNYNIIFLPRYESDKDYVKGIKNVFIPPEPLNGLDACFFAKAVITGAGTLAREAACLGIPAISFYSGKKMLAVDKQMIRKGKIFFSRDPQAILDYINSSQKADPDLERSKKVKEEVLKKIEEVIKNF